jgi:ParB/RepB/Spo0J family partition protein
MPDVISSATFAELPLESIRLSATNPRKSVDAVALEELMQSIRVSGVQVPVLVRPTYDPLVGAADYELVAGSRRLAACARLDLETIPAIVREMNDEQVRDAQIIENLQRADVQPLEEAEAFQGVLERAGSIAEVALRLGKEQSYVAKCLRLLALTLPSRDALRGRLITIEHALLLARLADAEQNAALKWTLDHSAGSKMPVEKVLEGRLVIRKTEEADKNKDARYMRHTWEPQSVVRLKAWIEAESGILLSRAPWSLTDDTLLPGVGPCATCAKNTRANAPLFGDLEMGEATCTDGAQFAAKTEAFVQIAMMKAGHSMDSRDKVWVPRLSWKYSGVKPAICINDRAAGAEQTMIANPAKVLKQGQWVEAKPGSCAYVRPGVTMDWSDDGERGYMGSGKQLRKPGETLQVCLAVGCKVHPKDWEPEKSSSRREQGPSPEEQKRLAAQRQHLETEEAKIRAKLLYAMLAKLDAAKAVKLVADRRRDAAEWRKRLLSVMPELDGAGDGGARLEAFVVFCSAVEFGIRANGYWLMQPGGVARDRKDVVALAKLAGVNADQVIAKHFHDAGGIAPLSDPLYPKGVPWPKGAGAAVTAKQAVSKPGKKAAVKKPGTTKVKLDAAARRRIVDATKKRWAEARKPAAKAVPAKTVAKKTTAKKVVAAKGGR